MWFKIVAKPHEYMTVIENAGGNWDLGCVDNKGGESLSLSLKFEPGQEGVYKPGLVIMFTFDWTVNWCNLYTPRRNATGEVISSTNYSNDRWIRLFICDEEYDWPIVLFDRKTGNLVKQKCSSLMKEFINEWQVENLGRLNQAVDLVHLPVFSEKAQIECSKF